MGYERMEGNERKESKESLRIESTWDILEVRHGDRTVRKPDGTYTGGEELSSLGDKSNEILADVIAQRPQYQEGKLTDVEVIGSTIRSAREKEAGEPGRATKTAEAFAKTIGKGGDVKPAVETDILSYKILKHEPPYRHERYNEVFQEVRAGLAEANPQYDEETLNDLAADSAQNAITEDLVSLLNPTKSDGAPNPDFEKASAYARECAGAHAYLIMHYAEKLQRGGAGTNGLTSIGHHGPTLEPLLKYALVRTIDGQQTTGFEHLSDIGIEFAGGKSGGHQHTSESFTFSLQKMSDGSIRCPVRFNDPSKFGIGENLHLDMGIVKQLADEFKSDSLHPELDAASKESGTEYGAIQVKL